MKADHVPDTAWKQGTRRPTIPIQTQRELWARAAGRCEFRGCNELLYKDDLTQNRSNLATIAHIVAYSPKGPRGHDVRSKTLETELSNLMLTCKKHGDMIDDRALEPEYPESLLLDFKREHEDRVRIATGVQEEAQTHVLLIQGPVDSRAPRLDERKAHVAIRPKYPALEHPYEIDLASLRVPASSPGFYDVALPSVKNHLQEVLRVRPGDLPVRTLSVFAIAPIPLLAFAGHVVGDTQAVDLYQCHRTTQEYAWPFEEEAEPVYDTFTPTDEELDLAAPVALVLSISGLVERDLVRAALDAEPAVYELRARGYGRDFLRSEMRLQLFGYELRQLFEVIRARHGHDRPVHVFAAIPAPAAFDLGRNVKHVDPPMALYDFEHGKGYVYKITINEP